MPLTHTPCQRPHPNTTLILGALTEANVAELSPQFKGWLYLCGDVGEDEGVFFFFLLVGLLWILD